MLNVYVVGCNGRMGKLVCNLINESEEMCLVGGFDSNCGPEVDFPGIDVSSSIIDLSGVDVVIDFSRPSATLKAVEAAIEYNVPMVIATTGFSDDQEATIEEAAQNIPIFKSANMSLGVNLFNRLVSVAAKILDDYDPEIHEVHHSRKADSPSGTAKMLAQTIASNRLVSEITYGRTGKRIPNEIGISSSRGGNVSGDHTVYFFGENDTITLSHHADSPSIFAKGALKCASYIADMFDCRIYTMYDLLSSLGI